MTASAPAPRSIPWLLAALWGGMPLYPSFIALLPITPPGVSLIGPAPALSLLAGVGIITIFVARSLWTTFGRDLFADRLVQAMVIYLVSMALPSALGFVPVVGAVFCLISLCTCIGAIAVRKWGGACSRLQ